MVRQSSRQPTHARHDMLTALLKSPARPHRYESKQSGQEATIYLYDMIGQDPWTGGGISAKQFAEDLAALKASVVHLRINSPGGDVFDGRAIATAISEYPGKTIAHVDGVAASAASYIALAANEVEFAPAAMMMIHRAWTVAFGNAEDLAQTIEVLQKIDDSMAKDYARQTGNTAQQALEWMSEETWFSAEEAMEHGFADRIAEEAVSASAEWGLSIYESGGHTARELENSLRQRGYSRSEARAIVSGRKPEKIDPQNVDDDEVDTSGKSAADSGTLPGPQWDAEHEELEQAARSLQKSLHEEAITREVSESNADEDEEFIEGLKSLEESLVAVGLQRRWKRLSTS